MRRAEEARAAGGTRCLRLWIGTSGFCLLRRLAGCLLALRGWTSGLDGRAAEGLLSA